MQLSALAETYIHTNHLTARTIVINTKRFERITGITDPAQVSLPVLDGFRQATIACGLAHATIEKTITDVTTIIKSIHGTLPDIGKRLKQPRPKPNVVPLSEIDAIFAAAKSQRLRRWLALTYWTGLRITDSVYLYWKLNAPIDVLRLTAQKTGIHHCWPVPHWLRSWMLKVEPHSGVCSAWFGRLLRDELAATCIDAGVKVRTPKHIRQTAITEWSMSNATAGAIVHGSGIGVLAHYIDPLSVLQAAAPRVRIPTCFRSAPDQSAEESFLSNFRRLDPAAQNLIGGMAERLAAG